MQWEKFPLEVTLASSILSYHCYYVTVCCTSVAEWFSDICSTALDAMRKVFTWRYFGIQHSKLLLLLLQCAAQVCVNDSLQHCFRCNKKSFKLKINKLASMVGILSCYCYYVTVCCESVAEWFSNVCSTALDSMRKVSTWSYFGIQYSKLLLLLLQCAAQVWLNDSQMFAALL